MVRMFKFGIKVFGLGYYMVFILYVIFCFVLQYGIYVVFVLYLVVLVDVLYIECLWLVYFFIIQDIGLLLFSFVVIYVYL